MNPANQLVSHLYDIKKDRALIPMSVYESLKTLLETELERVSPKLEFVVDPAFIKAETRTVLKPEPSNE